MFGEEVVHPTAMLEEQEPMSPAHSLRPATLEFLQSSDMAAASRDLSLSSGHWWEQEPLSPAPSLPAADLNFFPPEHPCTSPVLPATSLPAADLGFALPKKPHPSHFGHCDESTESCYSTMPPSTELTSFWTSSSTLLRSPRSSQSLSRCRDAQLHCAQPLEALGDNSLSSELLTRHDNLCPWQHSTMEMASPQVCEVHACFLKACKTQATPRQHLGTV
jgi:hypothetical protein